MKCSHCNGSGEATGAKKPEAGAISEEALYLAKLWSEQLRNVFASRPKADDLDKLQIDGVPILPACVNHIVRVFGYESFDTQVKLAYFTLIPEAERRLKEHT